MGSVGLKLAAPATLTLPFDESAVTAQDRFDDEVKVWVLGDSTWGQELQTDGTAGQVTVQLNARTTAAAGVNPPAPSDIVHLSFKPNPKFVGCVAGDSSKAPTVEADIVRGSLNDGMFLRGKNIKPGLQFDLFTVENSSLLANGTPDPNFKNFGLAWYQSNLEAESDGSMRVTIRTILLDRIFGFDPNATLPPTGTFEMGFWFNNPRRPRDASHRGVAHRGAREGSRMTADLTTTRRRAAPRPRRTRQTASAESARTRSRRHRRA